MINWNEADRHTEFRYVRVSWPSLDEMGLLEGITGCKLDESTTAALKVSGSLQYTNLPDLGDDLVRIYSDSQFKAGKETVCHGTLFVARPKNKVTDNIYEGTAELYSALLVMRQTGCEETYTLPQDVKMTEVVSSLIKDCGLNPIVTSSDVLSSTSHSWDIGTEYLEIANEILEMINYGPLDVDAYGNVLVEPYVDPATKNPAAILSDTQDSVGAGTFTHDFDTYEVPNVIILSYSNAKKEPLISIAVNDDPESKFSTINRKKRICKSQRVQEATDQRALDAKARELLNSSMVVVEAIDINHSWLPFKAGDAVLFDYQRSNIVMKLYAESRSIQMTPDISCTTKLRRFVNLLEE